jgi:hypothetical protein
MPNTRQIKAELGRKQENLAKFERQLKSLNERLEFLENRRKCYS